MALFTLHGNVLYSQLGSRLLRLAVCCTLSLCGGERVTPDSFMLAVGNHRWVASHKRKQEQKNVLIKKKT